jgi:hypothetical protein
MQRILQRIRLQVSKQEC